MFGNVSPSTVDLDSVSNYVLLKDCVRTERREALRDSMAKLTRGVGQPKRRT
jgi:hypothetical protein